MRYAAGVAVTMTILFGAAVSDADMGFDPRYERAYNIYVPSSRYEPDNPVNPVNKYNLDVPFAPLDGGGR